jgi:ECF transporter S component (folate family)
MSRVKKLVFASLLLALQIILGNPLAIRVPMMSIVSFSYIPAIFCAVILGPAWSVGVEILSDVIGALLFPNGPFFLGFTLNALLVGLIYGFLLYNTKDDKQFLRRLILSVVIITVFIHIGLNSLWLSMMYKKAFVAFTVPRIVRNLILIPLKVSTVFMLKKFLDVPIKKFLNTESDSTDGQQDKIKTE